VHQYYAVTYRGLHADMILGYTVLDDTAWTTWSFT